MDPSQPIRLLLPARSYQNGIKESYLCLLVIAIMPLFSAEILRLMCGKYANFAVEVRNKRLQSTFLTFHGKDKVQCQFECINNNQCKTFNINEDTMICELNNKSTEIRSDNVTMINATGWTYYATSYKEALVGYNCAEKKPCQPGFMCKDICDCPGYQCKAMRSCLDWHRRGVKNGAYEIIDRNDSHYPVFCDFESEATSVWTLITSHSLANKDLFKMRFYTSSPRNEDDPNWMDYRLGLQRMQNIHSLSTMWRATCSFPIRKADIFRDYIRAQLQNIDILTYKDTWRCLVVDYINIRGHEGKNVTVPFWQPVTEVLHTDSSTKTCAFDATEGSVVNEDNFGFYDVHNENFTCTQSNSSTTQLWMGTNIQFKSGVDKH